MTGIERLREFVAGISPFTVVCGVTSMAYDREHTEVSSARLRGFLADIADQIEREQGGRVSSMRVLAVVTDMERHCLGHEGMEDSPVARWARELREALGDDVRDPAADVSVSAYDLLPQEDREAIAWVRDHGGLDAVKRRWECLSYYADPVPRSCMKKRLARLQRQIDESHAALRRRNRRIAELEHLLRKEMSYSLRRDAGCLAPEALDAEGVEIRVGDTVYEVDTGEQMWVCALPEQGAYQCVKLRLINGMFKTLDPCRLTHRAPVLAADGAPIKKDERVFGPNGGQYRVTSAHDGKVFARHVDGPFGAEVESAGGEGLYRLRADKLTHTKPEIDTWQRIEEDANKGSCDYFGCDANGCHGCPAYGWNVARGGSGCGNAKMRDLVCRCRALAERERGE